MYQLTAQLLSDDAMQSEYPTHKIRHVYLKAYEQLEAIKKAIYHIQPNESLQISVIGKFDNDSLLEQDGADKKLALQQYWEEVLHTPNHFGYVSSPELGTIFIAGALVSMFLHEIEGKAIGEMPTGVYGILRGMGFHQNTVDLYLKDLLKGDYLLLIRGYKRQISAVQLALDAIE